jgi:hypothetical protein
LVPIERELGRLTVGTAFGVDDAEPTVRPLVAAVDDGVRVRDRGVGDAASDDEDGAGDQERPTTALASAQEMHDFLSFGGLTGTAR